MVKYGGHLFGLSVDLAVSTCVAGDAVADVVVPQAVAFLFGFALLEIAFDALLDFFVGAAVSILCPRIPLPGGVRISRVRVAIGRAAIDLSRSANHIVYDSCLGVGVPTVASFRAPKIPPRMPYTHLVSWLRNPATQRTTSAVPACGVAPSTLRAGHLQSFFVSVPAAGAAAAFSSRPVRSPIAVVPGVAGGVAPGSLM
jgi:hypothetical protein